MVIAHLVYKLIIEHANELVTAVNLGQKDPEDLAAVVVQEDITEEEIITDPVLKALRKFDEAHTNMVRMDFLRDLFDEMAQDELQVETHKFYGEISDPEVQFLKAQLEATGTAVTGEVACSVFKEFIEDQEIAETQGGKPNNLVGTLLSMKMESCLATGDVSCIMSPRSWRARFDGGQASPRTKKSPEEGDDEDKGKKDKK